MIYYSPCGSFGDFSREPRWARTRVSRSTRRRASRSSARRRRRRWPAATWSSCWCTHGCWLPRCVSLVLARLFAVRVDSSLGEVESGGGRADRIHSFSYVLRLHCFENRDVVKQIGVANTPPWLMRHPERASRGRVSDRHNVIRRWSVWQQLVKGRGNDTCHVWQVKKIVTSKTKKLIYFFRLVIFGEWNLAHTVFRSRKQHASSWCSANIVCMFWCVHIVDVRACGLSELFCSILVELEV